MKRIIPCLDVKDGKTVKGINFVNLRNAGDPAEMGLEYCRQGADELALLDITATQEELGKPVGSDKANEKNTFATIMSIGECEEIIQSETKKAIEAIKGKFENPEFLIELANKLSTRDK